MEDNSIEILDDIVNLKVMYKGRLSHCRFNKTNERCESFTLGGGYYQVQSEYDEYCQFIVNSLK